MLVLRAVDVCQVGLARTPNIRCIYSTFGREITKCTVIYGVYVVILAGKSQNIRSYTVHIYGPGQP